MTLLRRVLDATERYLRALCTEHYAVSPAALGLYRIAYAGFLLLYGVPSFAWVSANPDAFFFPPPWSLPGFFAPGIPPAALTWALSGGVAVTLAMILLGWRTRWASVTFSVATVAGLSFTYSFGKIDHNLIVWVIPFVMAWSGWGRRFSVDAMQGRVAPSSPGRRGVPVAVITLLLGFCMWTAGVQKIIGGWLMPDSHAAYGHVLQAVHVFDRSPLLASPFLSLDAPVLLEMFDVLVVAFEVGFLAACFHRRTARAFAAGALLFHLGVFLTMGIRTDILLVVYALILVDWERAADRLASRPELSAALRHPAVYVTLATAVVGLYLWGAAGGLPGAKSVSILAPFGL